MPVKQHLALLALGAMIFACSSISEEEGTDREPVEAESLSFQPEDEIIHLGQPLTGDLDSMLARRQLRALVPYNRVSYFIDGTERRGIIFEGVQLFEQFLNEQMGDKVPRINIVFIPVPREKLIPLLVAGYGDLAAAGITVRPALEQKVTFSHPLMTSVREVPVGGPKARALEHLDDLAGQEVHVRASSPYYGNLQRLSDSLEEAGLPAIKIIPADENLEDDDILEMVNAGLYPFTVINDYQSVLWRQIMDSIQIYQNLPLSDEGEIAWAFRKDSPLLKEKVNAFVKKNKAGTLTGNILINRYLKSTRYVDNALSPEGQEKFRVTRDIFRKYGEEYGINWLLLAAQGYQESRLDQSRVSSAGAVGIMQIKPSTAADPRVGIPNIYNMENNIHAGTKYLRFIADHYFGESRLDTMNLGLLSLASYNAGPNRVARLRREAKALGLDPNVWFDNVELIAAREVGREPVQYVSNIYKYYLSYQSLADYLEATGQQVVKQ